ncbi:MAG TPA: DUF4249 domain-containing protein [Chitinophagaceae bacterium]|nr:DUF4249 domain-containing protein [Chitinophagaceae bacterium]
MKTLVTIILFALAVFIGSGCKKPYEPRVLSTITNFLVVDGNIAVGNDQVTRIVLSRTTRLSDSVTFDPENNATVLIEQEQGGMIQLFNRNNGLYESPVLSLQPGANYRLRVLTANKEYFSEFVSARVSPPIDSVTWRQDNDVFIYVNTHDPSNQTRYYRWEYVETWNYASFLVSPWAVSDGLIFVKDSLTQTDSCWRSLASSQILVASTAALSQDVVSNFQLARVQQHSEKIGMGYNILVRQYAITDEAYRYFSLIQKNTEQLGTLFDGQPSQLKGNIHCTQDPGEPVIGFVTASTVSEKRTVIRNKEVDWNFIQPGPDCSPTIVIPQHPDNFKIYDYPDPEYTIYYYITGGTMRLAKKVCLDCRALGGTNEKPAFW